MWFRWAILIAATYGVTNCAVADERPMRAEDWEHFERKVRPLLSRHCYGCHSSDAKTVHGGLRLDHPEAIRRGGDSGPVVIAGQPEQSLLIQTVGYDGDIQMPPKGKLSSAEIAALTRWVAAGAALPESTDPPPRENGDIDFKQGKRFWAFQPLRRQQAPALHDTNWPRTPIDSFVLAAMKRQGLGPSRAADRATLVRRLYFDVLGLPPTPEQVQRFVNDRSPDAYRSLVDQLLASPAYGERWGRWWLDFARYTDRTASWLYQSGQSHLYRDWVVQAFNDDLPYDQFIHRQLATDLMSTTGPEDLPALGFISLSPTYWKELKLPCEIIKVIVADEWEERVDAVSRTFLGLTVACARCHDHKFDPISSEDYYALAGVFASCRQVERPVISEQRYEPVRLAKKKVSALEEQIKKLRKEKPLPREKVDDLQEQIKQIKASTPLYDTPMASALSEESMFVVRSGKTAQDGTRLDYRAVARDLPVFVRGDPNRPGPVVRRRFLTVLSADAQPFQSGSGRLELAQAITRDAAPLVARVLVNRVWLEHFGRGIVETPSNFGTQGSPPTHPELLDDLAARFVAGGWSIKKLHREILLSATWRQSSNAVASTASSGEEMPSSDPENRWWSRMNRRRLPLESWRDAMMVAGNSLDRRIGGPSSELDAPDNHRRTVYATVHRRDMSTTMMVHDFPDPTQHSPRRNATQTALQGLYAINGPLLMRQADALVDRVLKEYPNDVHRRIDRAYWLLFARGPSQREVNIAVQFLDSASDEVTGWRQYVHMLLASNEFLFID